MSISHNSHRVLISRVGVTIIISLLLTYFWGLGYQDFLIIGLECSSREKVNQTADYFNAERVLAMGLLASSTVPP